MCFDVQDTHESHFRLWPMFNGVWIMFQMAFGFCPICGKVYTVFVDGDWLITPEITPFPCEDCFENVLTDEQRVDIDNLLFKTEKETGEDNG